MASDALKRIAKAKAKIAAEAAAKPKPAPAPKVEAKPVAQVAIKKTDDVKTLIEQAMLRAQKISNPDKSMSMIQRLLNLQKEYAAGNIKSVKQFRIDMSNLAAIDYAGAPKYWEQLLTNQEKNVGKAEVIRGVGTKKAPPKEKVATTKKAGETVTPVVTEPTPAATSETPASAVDPNAPDLVKQALAEGAAAEAAAEAAPIQIDMGGGAKGKGRRPALVPGEIPPDDQQLFQGFDGGGGSAPGADLMSRSFSAPPPTSMSEVSVGTPPDTFSAATTEPEAVSPAPMEPERQGPQKKGAWRKALPPLGLMGADMLARSMRPDRVRTAEEQLLDLQNQNAAVFNFQENQPTLYSAALDMLSGRPSPPRMTPSEILIGPSAVRSAPGDVPMELQRAVFGALAGR